MKIFILISCCKTKLPYSAPAEQLYQSAGFKKSLAYAKSLNPDGIFILSALHHLVSLDSVLEPYNVCLNDFTSDKKRDWSKFVIKQLSEVADIQNDKFIILAGKNYYSELLPFLPNYSLPLEGLGLGKRLAWLDEHTITENSPCLRIHKFFNSLPRYDYTFNKKDIPENGLYVFFEKGEKYCGMDRIVRVGTHTGESQLYSRLQQHLLNENKDRSIFRKNIGRAILNKENNSFLEKWNLDLTTKANKEKYSKDIDFDFQKKIEKRVSQYMHENLSFAVISIDSKEERLNYESYLIHTISADTSLKPSVSWLGNYSPVKKIRESGLWLVNELTLSIKKSNFRFVYNRRNKTMSNWKTIWKRAEAAKNAAIFNRDISSFADLLLEFPNDGMVHYQLGLAYKEIGEKENALKEFKKAETLLIMPRWKAKARAEISYLSEQNDSNDDDIADFDLKNK